ncbi:MAG: zinc ribbon-containing protein [Hahellaceae bacterium]|nr:zinc ribbon-containing protein [Hahellaceae bacterium]
MEKQHAQKHSAEAAKVYNRMLERAEKTIAQLEVKSWEAIKAEIDEAIEFEHDLAELTREEVDLLGAYIKRDLQQFSEYVAETGQGIREWFRMDIALVEERVREALLSIADKTQVGLLELDQKIHHDPGLYMTGEIACAGMLQCSECGYMMCLTETRHIDACHQCGSHYFKRITSRWPPEPELEGGNTDEE